MKSSALTDLIISIPDIKIISPCIETKKRLPIIDSLFL